VTGTRRRVAALAVVVVLAVTGTVAYLLVDRSRLRPAAAAPVVALASVQASGSYLVFRDTALGAHYGAVAAVSLSHPGGPRAVTTRSCDRVAASRGSVLCLSSKPGVAVTYRADVLSPDVTHEVRQLPLTGLPSRARLSADGRHAATTSFTAGDSYASTSFSTRTVVSDLTTGRSVDLEQFTLHQSGRTIRPVDRNFWGVTFAADGDGFYATVAFGGHTHLVRGSLRARTVTVLHDDAECPSLSPDGRTVAYKQRGDLPPGHWRLVTMDLASGVVTPLAETRSVDDQVEWLDSARVLYGLHRSGTAAAESDVWVVPADGSGAPEVLVADAWSPTVVHAT
jgi:hypothetical protein